MLGRDAVRILIDIVPHIKLKRKLKPIVNLLPFPSGVVQLDPVETEGQHGREPAHSGSFELSCFILADLALNAIQLLERKQLLKRLLHAFVALDSKHEVKESFGSLSALIALGARDDCVLVPEVELLDQAIVGGSEK